MDENNFDHWWGLFFFDFFSNLAVALRLFIKRNHQPSFFILGIVFASIIQLSTRTL